MRRITFSNGGTTATGIDKVNIGNSPVKVTVIGLGAFGTAMAYAASRNGHQVVGWVRDTKMAVTINNTHRNPKYFSDIVLPDNISATDNLAEALDGTSLIIHALPCQKTPEWLKANRDLIPPHTLYVLTCKGLYLPTKQLMGHAVYDALDRDQPMAFLSGPSFAKGILNDDPTALVCAAKNLYHAVAVQKVMNNSKLRVYTSQDTIGVQLGGALKNPLAVGAGMICASGFGVNTLTAYITRGAAELSKLCVAMGGEADTIAGLSGIGDLMLTCMSSESRNNTCGKRLAEGETIEDITKNMTVEGVPTANVAIIYADLCNLELPIFREIHRIICGKVNPADSIPYLMGRDSED